MRQLLLHHAFLARVGNTVQISDRALHQLIVMLGIIVLSTLDLHAQSTSSQRNPFLISLQDLETTARQELTVRQDLLLPPNATLATIAQTHSWRLLTKA